MEHLSPEVLAIVCASLTDVDVFHLSHTSSRLLRHASTSAIWQRVVNVSNPRVFFDARDIDDLDIAARLKKQYASSRSMRFRGVPLKVEERVSYGCGSFAALRELPPSHRSPAMTEILAGRVGGLSMTISVWFSLLPPSGEVLAGGVLFGAQEAGAASNTPINKAQQPVMMSPQGKLYCSLLESATNVELEEDLQLETDRWYHLVLMYYGPVQKERLSWTISSWQCVMGVVHQRCGIGCRLPRSARASSCHSANTHPRQGSRAGTASTALSTTCASGAVRSRVMQRRGSKLTER